LGRNWEGDGINVGEKGEGGREGSLGSGKKGGKGKGGNKSPAWLSQDLGSTGRQTNVYTHC